MTIRGVSLGLIAVAVSLLAFSQTNQQSTSQKAGRARTSQMQVAPDLKQRLARFRQVQMPFNSDGLSPRQKKMILKLVDACRYLDDIYWRQVDPQALELYKSLEASTDPKDAELRRYLWINGSRYDLLNGDEPFVGTT